MAHKDGAAAAAADALLDVETRFFGESPLDMLDGLARAMHESACNAFDSMERDMLTGHAPLAGDADAVRAAIDQATERCLAGLTKNVDKLELYALRNVLLLPPGLDTTGLSTGHGEGATADQEAELDAELATLRRRLLAGRYVHAAMRAELERIQSDLAAFEPHQRALDAFVAASKAAAQPLTHNVRQAQQQAEQLRELAEKAHALWQRLPSANAGAEGATENAQAALVAAKSGIGTRNLTALRQLL